MKVVKCDRCGEFIREVDRSLDNADLSADIVMFVKGPLHRGNAHIDLCDSCKASFVEWLGVDIPEKTVTPKVLQMKAAIDAAPGRGDKKPKRQSTTKK